MIDTYNSTYIVMDKLVLYITTSLVLGIGIMK